MTEILNLALPFFGLIALGVLATRFWAHDERGLAWINTFLIYFALPALIFRVVAAAPFEKLLDWPFVSLTTSVTTFAFLITLALSRWFFATPLRTAALQGTAATYGNVGYMGLPLAVAFFGPEAAVPAALVFCFDCTAEFVLTAFFATLAHEDNEESHWAEVALRILRQVATHPFIVATVAGTLASAFAFEPPAAIATVLAMLTQAVGPCALFALGVSFGLRRFARFGRELPLLVAVKTLFQPLAAWLALGLLPGLDPVWLHVAVMMAALPTASSAFILASQYKTYVEGASTAVIATTIVSAFTIPAIVYVFKAGILP